MPRKTDSSNPADWLWLADSDLDAIRLLAGREVGYPLCRSKLAEVLEEVLKAELYFSDWLFFLRLPDFFFLTSVSFGHIELQVIVELQQRWFAPILPRWQSLVFGPGLQSR